MCVYIQIRVFDQMFNQRKKHFSETNWEIVDG